MLCAHGVVPAWAAAVLMEPECQQQCSPLGGTEQVLHCRVLIGTVGGELLEFFCICPTAPLTSSKCPLLWTPGADEMLSLVQWPTSAYLAQSWQMFCISKALERKVSCYVSFPVTSGQHDWTCLFDIAKMLICSWSAVCYMGEGEKGCFVIGILVFTCEKWNSASKVTWVNIMYWVWLWVFDRPVPGRKIRRCRNLSYRLKAGFNL